MLRAQRQQRIRWKEECSMCWLSCFPVRIAPFSNNSFKAIVEVADLKLFSLLPAENVIDVSATGGQ